ncbi:transcriptional repressor [Rhodobacteraceae bacterium NNCM2]|nr:transcriptional repressor [Coraliihabitans acroporae]
MPRKTTEKLISPTDGRTAHERADVWLSGAGLRPTRQRIALAELLVGDGYDRHVTAESLFEAVQTTGASVSLATVYNTLRSFTEAGLVNEITVDGTRSYFDTNISDHAHFHFDDGRVVDATHGPASLQSLPDVPAGYEISKIDVVIRLRKKG